LPRPNAFVGPFGATTAAHFYTGDTGTFIGGVQVDGVFRVRDTFLETARVNAGGAKAALDIQASTLSGAEGLLNEPGENGGPPEAPAAAGKGGPPGASGADKGGPPGAKNDDDENSPPAEIAIIDLKSLRVIRSVKSGHETEGVEFSADGKELLVTNEGGRFDYHASLILSPHASLRQ